MVQVADVVRRVAGGGEALEPERRGRRRRGRSPPAPARARPRGVEGVAVEAARARLEPARVDDVRRADLGDVHLEPGCSRTSTPAAPAWSRWMCESSRWRTSVELEPALGEARLQRGDARRRPAVVERRPVVGLEQVARRRRARSWWWRSIGSGTATAADVDPAAGRRARQRARALEVGDQVVGRLDPDREADEVRGAANGASAVEACVIAPAARSGSRRRRGSRRASRSASARRARPPPRARARNETIPPKSRIWRARARGRDGGRPG